MLNILHGKNLTWQVLERLRLHEMMIYEEQAPSPSSGDGARFDSWACHYYNEGIKLFSWAAV